MKRIVFVAPPFAGHLNPQVPLARGAQDAGYDVEFITGERRIDALTQLGLAARSLTSIGPDTLESIANGSRRVGSNPVLLLQQFRQNLRLLPAIRAELLLVWRKNPPNLVVADSVAPVAGLVCEELGIPWITTIATPFALENRRGAPAYCGGWGAEHGPWSSLRNAVGRFGIRTFKRGVAWRFRDEFAASGLGKSYREDGSEAIYSRKAILGFGLEELEFERDWPSAFRMIGPVIDSPESCPALHLPTGKRRVLVTLGTHLLWAKKALPDDVVRLAKVFPDVHFAVSLGEPGNAMKAAEQISECVTLFPFVPYARDLEKFDAVIHHGGAGVTYAAIRSGVPSLVIPHDYDQFDFAARIVHHGLGLQSKSLAGSATALAQVLNGCEWPALADFQSHFRRYRPVETFLETVSEIVGPADSTGSM